MVPIARRVLGTPVGWPRSLLVCAGMVLGFGPLLTTIGKKAHLVSQHGNRIDTLASPGITTLFVLLAGFWVFAIGLSVLVVSEVLVPTGTVPSPVAVISGWRARRRRTRRYLAVVAIATKHGLGGFIRRGARDGRGDQTRTARALRLTLDEAGVTFVKAGQLAATRGDLLPEAYIRELSLLQTQAAPAAWPDIRASIEQSLGRPLTDVFAEISSEPLAAASVAQVHAALLLDGTPVVVKVQRPAARRVVTADLDILMRLARRLDGTTAWGHRLGVLRLAEGFAESLRDELDYTVEQDNTRDVALGLPLTDPPVRIPHVHTQYSSPTLLVMDRLVGVPVSEADELLAGFSAAERAELAARLLRETLREILVSGVFHADLHPGNVFVAPDHGLGLLDFGSVGRLDEPTRHSLAVCLLAVDRNDAITATDTLLELLDHPERLDERQLEREVGQLITRFRGGLGASGSAGLVSRLLGIVHRHGL
ncbi:MAG: AarF/ABC1/UbiB kinase family protein, partial [Actinobacteria bacterium]|nr:AarF/ABC1/UbiB kinase family protein [Actinomycetota bacterium]